MVLSPLPIVYVLPTLRFTKIVGAHLPGTFLISAHTHPHPQDYSSLRSRMCWLLSQSMADGTLMSVFLSRPMYVCMLMPDGLKDRGCSSSFPTLTAHPPATPRAASTRPTDPNTEDPMFLGLQLFLELVLWHVTKHPRASLPSFWVGL
jgi:hypothetical protein